MISLSHNTKKPTTKTHKKITKFTTKASWYGPHFNGKKTASGQIFNQNQLTAASKILPFGTKVLVKNPRNGKTCVVTINDRGPYVKGRGIDLSKASAQKLGITGVSPVICYANASSPTKFTSVKAYRTKSGGYHFTIFMKIKRAFHPCIAQATYNKATRIRHQFGSRCRYYCLIIWRCQNREF